MPALDITNEKWAAALALTVLLSGTLFGVLSVLAFSWFLYRHSTLPQELSVFFAELAMEQQARHALDLIKNVNVLLDIKLDILGKLKASIKHENVPELAIAVCFEVVRVAITMSQLLDTGFSILSHLTKRLVLQAQHSTLATQARLLYSCLTDRLGDAKDRVRNRAIQAFADFWPISPTDVEEVIRDNALTSKIAKTKEAGMQWVTKMHDEHGLQFRSYVSRIVDCLEDADGSVRDVAKVAIIHLFKSAPQHAQSDLRRQMHQKNVRKAIVAHINAHLPVPKSDEPALSSSTRSVDTEATAKNQAPGGSTTSENPGLEPAPSVSKSKKREDGPIQMNSARELEDFFHDMHCHFEGKESDQNWNEREKCILKLRLLTKGDGPNDYASTYLQGIKGLLDGILKCVNSLRTTLSNQGFELIRDIADLAGPPRLDSMVEILLQSLIKLCGATKKITAENSDLTVNVVLASVTYNVRLAQHVWNACQDKNTRPRQFAAIWLQTLISKHANHRSTIEHAGGLDLIDAGIYKGLIDANVNVRENMRPTYWIFARVWPERAESIMRMLDEKKQSDLKKHYSNPDHRTFRAADSSLVTVPKEPSVKEVIVVARKQASMAELKTHQPLTTTSNTSKTGTLSSAPVRPARKMKTVPSSQNLARENIPMRSKTPVPASSHENTRSTNENASYRPKTPTVTSSHDTYKPRNQDMHFRSKTPVTASNHEVTRATSGTTSSRPKTPAITPSRDSFKVMRESTPSRSKTPIATSDRDTSKTASHTKPLEQETSSESPRRDDINAGNENTPLKQNTSARFSKRDVPKIARSPERNVLEELPLQDNKLAPSHRDTSLASSPERDVLEELPLQDSKVAFSTIPAPPPASIDITAKIMNLQSPSLAAKMLESGIHRIKSQTLDVHGFRKVQDLIRTREDIWDDDSMFEGVLLALLVHLETPYEFSNTLLENGRGDLRKQVLVTIRLLISQRPQDFSRYVPTALCAIVRARGHFSPKDHMCLLLEEAMEEMVFLTENQGLAIHSMLELLDDERDKGDDGNRATIDMGLCVLSTLLDYNKQSIEPDELTTEQEIRLVKLALDCTQATDADIRRFWKMMSSASVDTKNLLSYYLEKRAHGRTDKAASSASS